MVTTILQWYCTGWSWGKAIATFIVGAIIVGLMFAFYLLLVAAVHFVTIHTNPHFWNNVLSYGPDIILAAIAAAVILGIGFVVRAFINDFILRDLKAKRAEKFGVTPDEEDRYRNREYR